jgi:hypothetical protein
MHWAVLRYTQKNHKQDWSKLIQKEEWRRKVRQAIIDKDPSKVWCDHIAGTHACLELTPEQRQKQRLVKIFEDQKKPLIKGTA